MHIPDGYLSPETCVVMYGAAAPFWFRASRQVKKVLSTKAAPLLAIFAALSFTIQMFNIPVPTGTTAHAVGGTLMAVVLGPAAAVVGLTVVLIIQALFFGDGGITTIGANAFNTAIVLPLSGYAVYALMTRGVPSRRRRIIAAALGGYVGTNVAGLLVAIELGVQPILWNEGGRALYSPYGLQATIPAMAITHLTVAGFAEAALTAFVVSYLLRVQPALIAPPAGERANASDRLVWTLFGILVVLALLVPIGLLAPGSGAFEADVEEFRGLFGYVPPGLDRLAGLWQAIPLPDYQLPGLAAGSFFEQAPGYILSGVFGIALIFALTIAARIALSRRPGPGTRGR